MRPLPKIAVIASLICLSGLSAFGAIWPATGNQHAHGGNQNIVNYANAPTPTAIPTSTPTSTPTPTATFTPTPSATATATPSATFTPTATPTATATPTPTSTPTATPTATPTPTPTATPSGPLVQQATGIGIDSGSGVTVSFPSPTTDGNAIVVCISHATGSVSGVVTGNSDGLSLVASPAVGTGIIVDMYFISSVSPNSTIIVSADAAVSIKISISEWSGLNNAAPEDSSANTSLASSTVITGHIFPVSTNNLLIAVGGWTANNYSTGPNNGYTRMTPVGSLSAYQEVAYLIQSSTADTRCTWTLTAPLNSASIIAAFAAP